MVYEQASLFFETSSSAIAKTVIIASGLVYISLLIVAIFHPLLKKIKN
jgi:hypothetical protein